MIKNIRYIMTNETNPYRNLAMEEYLLHQVKEDEVILYLWQNEKTVVIGKNQNPWRECNIAELEADGGKLVRRLSGGGAVFHDLGNLNFTFLAVKDNYNVEKQLEVILKAVKELGIDAEKSGRNDITVEGKKFSGNAFYSEGVHCYHHGTILIQVEMNRLSHYLNVSREKLVSKGVESVRARVTNLTEYHKGLSVSIMKDQLIQAFGQVYGLEPVRLYEEELEQSELTILEQKFSSWDWNMGRRLEFDFSERRRFSWGEIELQFKVNSGRIQECTAYSDALEIGYFDRVTAALTGCRFTSADMVKTLSELEAEAPLLTIKEDILQLLKEAQL